LDLNKNEITNLKNTITPIINFVDTYQEDSTRSSNSSIYSIQLYELEEYFYKKAVKDIYNQKEYIFCEELIQFIHELLYVSSFILDIYTILRILKKTDISPYFVYCYFGNAHITGLLHYFTNILGKYKIVIKKENNVRTIKRMERAIS
jgi:hypothetical protein